MLLYFFFFKQKTAYEMRISDWSSDVCSSDLLVQLFETRFDPKRSETQRQDDEARIASALDTALDTVATLDGDRVLRAYAAVVRAALRTNYFQNGADGKLKRYVSIKLDPRKVPELPAPPPLFEVFAHAPEVEGIHLRGGRVARGGLRRSEEHTSEL